MADHQKSPQVQGILKTIAVLEAAYAEVFSQARAGMTAEEVDAILLRHLAPVQGEMAPPRSTPFVVGEGGAPPKLRFNREPFATSKLFGMDNSVRVGGWWADLGRYGYVGRVPRELAQAHAAVLRRQEELAAAVKPGLRMLDIYNVVKHDMPFEIHRVGPEPASQPYCGNATTGVEKGMHRDHEEGWTYQVGQVLCVEIWHGLSGGIEDMYLLEEGGLRRVSTLPREIREIKGT